mmetsp:Transcript_1252/g.1951  ORF Transcript_1252/g.1951 Transcript_1252/m.1951 type:complete len:141 (+) Transcript_1252:142-564(+)
MNATTLDTAASSTPPDADAEIQHTNASTERRPRRRRQKQLSTLKGMMELELLPVQPQEENLLPQTQQEVDDVPRFIFITTSTAPEDEEEEEEESGDYMNLPEFPHAVHQRSQKAPNSPTRGHKRYASAPAIVMMQFYSSV